MEFLQDWPGNITVSLLFNSESYTILCSYLAHSKMHNFLTFIYEYESFKHHELESINNI